MVEGIYCPWKGQSSYANTCLYPLSDVVSYDTLSARYQSFLSRFSTDVEPKSYTQVGKDPRWIEAMKAELQALEATNTWEVVTLLDV